MRGELNSFSVARVQFNNLFSYVTHKEYFLGSDGWLLYIAVVHSFAKTLLQLLSVHAQGFCFSAAIQLKAACSIS